VKYMLFFSALAFAACAPDTDGGGAPETGENPGVTPVETGAPAGEYRLDKYHASLVFRVDHLGYSFYTASFSDFDATLQFDPANPEAMSVTATIDAATLDLPNPPEGFYNDLMGPDWFRVSEFPKIAYRSTGVTLTGANTARVDGALTMLGETAPVALDVTFNGGYPGFHPHDPQGRIGFSAQGSLSRSAFGMTAGLPPEGSNLGAMDAVTFRVDAEFLGPPLPEPPEETPPAETE